MSYLENFYCKDKEKVTKKIDSILTSGKKKVHLVLDFDRTLTKNENKFKENVSTWEILSTHLNKKAHKEYKRLYDKYRPLEVENKMKFSDAAVWWEAILDLYKENKLKWVNILDDVEERMPIRNGVKELFNICDKKEIPTIIISAGIKDVIEMWCQRFEIKPTIVLSTNLFFNTRGFISGWDKNSLIHILNKKEKGHNEISKIRKTRPNIILIGDSLKDASMVSGSKGVLRIMVNDSRVDDSSSNGIFYNNIFKKFDLIVRNKSLFPVVDIIKFF